MAFNYKGTPLNYNQNSREGNAAQWVIDAYQNLMGRAPTNMEISEALPSALGSDPHISDIGGVNAFVASKLGVQEESDKQKKQLEDLGVQQDSTRKQRLQDLSQVLSQNADRMFSSNIAPAVAEDSNAKGIYTGTGYSDALAREKANLAGDVQNQLAVQGLTDTDALLGFQTQALQRAQDLNLGGLQREFSLQDFANQANTSRTIASSLAHPGSKTNAQAWGNAISATGAAASTYAGAKGGKK